MELKNYIEKAEKKAGSQVNLAKLLGISTGYIRNAKANKSGLPDPLCMQLADYINEDRLEIIAASNLITEKDKERRKILESCFKKTNRAASIFIAALLLAAVTITTPNPANASQHNILISIDFILCKILVEIKRIFNRLKNGFSGNWKAYFQPPVSHAY